MEDEKKQEKSKAERPGGFQESIISEQIKRRPINKYRLIRRTAVTALLAVIFGVVASVTIWLLEPLLSKWISRSDTTQSRETVHFIDTTDEVTPQEALSDYMDQEAFLDVEENTPESMAQVPLTD